MNVILISANSVNEDSKLVANTDRVRPHSRLEISCDDFAPILGAKHDMNYILRMRVEHVPHLRRLRF
jgi:hypothetical protein